MGHNVKASAVIGCRSCPLGGTLIQHRHEPIRSDRLRVARYRLRLPPASPARNSKAGKKESAGRRLSQLCRPYAVPSSNSSLDYPRSDARIVENGFATSGGLNKSAKVVLIRGAKNPSFAKAWGGLENFAQPAAAERSRGPT